MAKHNTRYIIPDIDNVTSDEIKELHKLFKPCGSGPISMMAIIYGLLEQIYKLKGFGNLVEDEKTMKNNEFTRV